MNHKNKDAELCVLGGLIKEPSLLENEDVILLRKEDFYYKDHAILFDAIKKLGANQPIYNYIEIKEFYKKHELVCDGFFLTGVEEHCPAPSQVPKYAKELIKLTKENVQSEAAIRFSQGKLTSEVLLDTLATERGKTYNRSDSGNAELFSELFGHIVRFDHTIDCWKIFDGKYWKPDTKKLIEELAKRAIKKRQIRALSINNDREKEMAFALKSEDHSKIQSMLNSTKSLPQISTTSKAWDRENYFQCNNKIIDLMNVEPFEPDPSYMTSQSSHIDFDLTAKCPTWNKVISEWMCGDKEMIEFTQRLMGYLLTDSTKEQCLFFLVGRGANGKSVFIDVLKHLLGDYHKTASMKTFLKTYGSKNFDIAYLHNARTVTANESGEGKKLDEERIKIVSHGDTIRAEMKYGHPFEFRSKMKLVFATNSLPQVDAFDEGLWRSIRVISFNRYFPIGERNPDLIDKLKAEISGILIWALDGLYEYYKQGLNPPEKVLKAVNSYREQEDEVAQFIEDYVEDQKGNSIPSKDVYRTYKFWHENNCDGKPMTMIKFSRRMGALGHSSIKIGGKKKYLDIHIKQDSRTL